MKRHIIFVLAGLLLFSSCFEDKGNYNYREVNEITLGALAESYTIAADVGMLNIDPVVKMSLADPDDERFQYLWIAEYKKTSFLETVHILDTIARTRVINWQADLPVYPYELRLKVIDTETGLTAQTLSELILTIYHGRGIMLAGEDEQGYSKAQMLVMMPGEETVFFDDILQYSGLPQLKGAMDFFHTGNTNPENSRAIWIVTEDGTYFVNRTSLKMEDNFYNFGHKMYFEPESEINPIDIAPRLNAANGNTGGYNNGMRYILCADGDVYHSWIATMGDVYDLPVSSINSTYFKAKPPIFVSTKTLGFGTVVCYDGDNERFVSLAMAGSECKVLADNPGDAFPWNQTTRTYIYGENTLKGSSNGFSFAIMKETQDDAAREYDYCLYELYATGPVKRAFYEIKKDQTPLFGSATHYAFSSNRTVMFYVVNGKLYAYDYDPSVYRNYEIALPDDNEVTMIKFDIQREPGSDYLYVATYSASTGGTLYKYAIDADLNMVKLAESPTETWTGLAKIKNMSWRGSE